MVCKLLTCVYCLYFVEKSKQLQFKHVDKFGMCYELLHEFHAGHHVLTVLPSSDAYVSLSYVLIP